MTSLFNPSETEDVTWRFAISFLRTSQESSIELEIKRDERTYSFVLQLLARVTVKHGFKIPIEALILSVNDTFLFCCSYTTINTIISITLNWLDNKTISVNVEQPRVLPLSVELNRRYETRFSAV